MGRTTRLPLPHRQALNRTLIFTQDAPPAAAHPPAVYVRALRCSLRMTQAQLARRAGVATSNVASVEMGKVDPQVGTLRKLLDAMFCDLLVVPKARQRPSEALAEREVEKPGRPWD